MIIIRKKSTFYEPYNSPPHVCEVIYLTCMTSLSYVVVFIIFELYDILKGLQFSWYLGYPIITFESDTKSTIDLILKEDNIHHLHVSVLDYIHIYKTSVWYLCWLDRTYKICWLDRTYKKHVWSLLFLEKEMNVLCYMQMQWMYWDNLILLCLLLYF